MRSYITIILFILLTHKAEAQLIEDDYEVNTPKNEIGLGLTILNPSGFYKQHLHGIFPGIALHFARRIGMSITSPHYVGMELNWTNLQTKKTAPFEFNPDGSIYTYYRYLDPELFSAFATYKLQPELKTILWPYLEAGLGCSWFYTVDRIKYPGQGEEEDEWVSDFTKSSAVFSYRLAIGTQYYITAIRSLVDVSWRFQYNGLVTYDVIDQMYSGNSVNPHDYFIEKRSRASNNQFKISLNYLF